jgi:hypothetical protein
MSGPVLDFESQKNIKCNKNEIKNQLKTLCVRTDPVAYNVTSINNPFHSSSMTSYVATIVIHLNLLFCKSVLKGSMACSLCSYCIFGLCQSFGILEERRLSQTTSLSGLRWRHEQVFTELGLLQATTRHKSLDSQSRSHSDVTSSPGIKSWMQKVTIIFAINPIGLEVKF